MPLVGVPVRVPSVEDFESYDGAHTPRLWSSRPARWRCPGCQRTRWELLTWTHRDANAMARAKGRRPYWGWLAALHTHHDHRADMGRSARFEETVICAHCNSADGAVKAALGLPRSWSFAPDEIGRFVRARPHAKHEIEVEAAKRLFWELHCG